MIYIIIIIVVILFLLFLYLLKQSKHPSGTIGKLMMKQWNRSYSDLYQLGINEIDNRNNIKKILDIGVGNGLSTIELSNSFSNANIIGIDISNTAINEAKERYKNKIKSNKVNFITGDISSLLMNKNSIDLVFAFQTHFHWNDFEQALENIYLMLKDDGVLVLGCEQAKINFFLKKYKKEDQLLELTNKIGYSKLELKKVNQYTIIKISKQIFMN